MNNNNSVCAVVCTYNRSELLRECVMQLLNQTQAVDEIMIVNNGCTDDTGKVIESFEKLSSIISHIDIFPNAGSAKGFCEGIVAAVKKGHSRLWIMDDDTFPMHSALEELVKFDVEIQGKFGYLASAVKWLDGSWCKMNLPTFTDSLCVIVEENGASIARATFVSLYFNVEAICKEGLPIEEFYIWGEDQEYTNRISKKWNCYFVGKSIVIHKMKKNIGSNIALDDERLDRYRYSYRNDFYRAKSNGVNGILDYLAYVIFTIANIIRRSKTKKMLRIYTVIKGFVSGLFFNPTIKYISDKNK